ncbi:histone family protein DNA-binding protein [Burkholderiales bacterium GJ-E10]|nr:histone family protein DNA-binding protein [Burkholderiales bacterium GJ-E10]
MNRLELAEKIAQEHDLSRAQAERILKTVTDTIVGVVKKGGTVGIVGFGTFKQTSRGARKGRNPATGEAVKIPARKVPKFLAGAGFKDAVDPKAAARRRAK